jgi:hypothetical protein
MRSRAACRGVQHCGSRAPSRLPRTVLQGRSPRGGLPWRAIARLLRRIIEGSILAALCAILASCCRCPGAADVHPCPQAQPSTGATIPEKPGELTLVVGKAGSCREVLSRASEALNESAVQRVRFVSADGELLLALDRSQVDYLSDVGVKLGASIGLHPYNTIKLSPSTDAESLTVRVPMQRSIRVGISASVCPSRLPSLIRALGESYPAALREMRTLGILIRLPPVDANDGANCRFVALALRGIRAIEADRTKVARVNLLGELP